MASEDCEALKQRAEQAEQELRGWKASQANFEGRLKEAERERARLQAEVAGLTEERNGLRTPENFQMALALNEIRELRAEVERLKGVIEDIALVTAYDEKLPGSIAGHVKVLTTDLAAEVERLRAALEQIVNGYYHNCLAESWFAEARAALEGRA